MTSLSNLSQQGILLVDKPKDKSSFYLVKILRSVTKIRKIGHTGTLDPVATGLMILLLGKSYTTRAVEFLHARKTYDVTIKLGQATDTYDCKGVITQQSDYEPCLAQIHDCISHFQGNQTQIPPMYSAKKIHGKKLYELARKNIEVARKPIHIQTNITFMSYQYPALTLQVECSSGTYIRTLCHDMGVKLGSYAHITDLCRTKNGPFSLQNALTISNITDKNFQIEKHLLQI